MPSLPPRIIRLCAGLAFLAALVWFVRQGGFRRSNNGPAGDALLPVDPAIVAAQLQELEHRENDALASVWAREQVADQASRAIETFWDALNRAEDPWKVVLALAPESCAPPAWGARVELPWGVTRRSPAGSAPPQPRANWAAQVAGWAATGWRISQSEFRHVGFETGPQGQPGRSRVEVRIHLQRPPAPDRAILRGELWVNWKASAEAPGEVRPAHIDATRLEWLDRQSPPPFEEIFREDLLPPAGSFFIDPLLAHDLDRDGQPEIILAARNRVYRRAGDGSLHASQLFPTDPPLIHSALFADFDGDGFSDFLHAGFDGLWLAPGKRGGGVAPDGWLAWSATPRLRYVQALTCGDVDGDGDLDVWVAQYKVPYERGQMPTPFDDANDGYPSHLLLNDGEGWFTDATEASGLAGRRHRRTYSASFVDLDGDRDLDLVLVSDFAGVDLFANDGHGRFVERTAAWLPNSKAFGMAHALGDFNRDGQADLLVIGMNSPAADRLNAMGLHRGEAAEVARRAAVTHGNRLYLGQAGQPFKSDPSEGPLARTGWSWGVAAADFDNDGQQDLYIANGHETRESVRDYEREFWLHDIYVGTSRDSLLANAYFLGKFGRTRGQGQSYGGNERNRLFLQQPGAGFVEVGHLMGVALGEDCRNVLATDLDGDGRLELLVTTFEIWPKQRQTLRIFANRFPDAGHWIGFRFPEGPGKPSPIGATLRLQAGGWTTVRPIVAGDSYRSQNTSLIHVGLGSTATVDSVEVSWPDGRSARLQKPPADRYHGIEPDLPPPAGSPPRQKP